MQPTERTPRGEIYDLGYQRYDGPRLGRNYALWSLFTLSVRNAFGIGRGPLPKALAFGLVLLAFVPALVQLMLAAVLPQAEFEFVRPEGYYGFVQVIIVLFVAAVATDLVGNDERNRVLALYFSRPLKRDDYALVKLAALATALLAITILPQAVMFAGNTLGASDGVEYLRDNADDILPIILSGLLICLMFGSIGIYVAAMAERRSFAIVAVLAVFLISLSVIQIVISLSDASFSRYAIFLSPFHVMRGFTIFLFDAAVNPGLNPQSGDPNQQVLFVDFPGIAYVIAALGWSAIAALLTIRHYRGSI